MIYRKTIYIINIEYKLTLEKKYQNNVNIDVKILNYSI